MGEGALLADAAAEALVAGADAALDANGLAPPPVEEQPAANRAASNSTPRT
jgi:hypothetical protein